MAGLLLLATVAAGTVVEPLISTSWGQDGGFNPKFTYNNKTPMFGTKRAPVGCGPVALGQVLKHYNYPKSGTGYTKYCSENGQTRFWRCDNVIEANFGAEHYNWEAMPDRLYTSSSTESIDAVSTLMYHIGASVKTKYGSEGSGAKLANPSVIRDFKLAFGLLDLERHERFRYSEDAWATLIKDEIKTGNPVVLLGHSPEVDADHAYILDGLNSEGKVHVNWGWSGNNNGYFNIHDLRIPYGSQMISFTEGLVALTKFNPHDLSEGTRCNGASGQRCAAGLACVAKATAGGSRIDYQMSDDQGTCKVDHAAGPDAVKKVEDSVETSVAKKEWVSFGPYTTETTVTVSVTGSGDVDLFVKKGAAPTEQQYDCRSAGSASDELCGMWGKGTYFVSVLGYRPSEITVAVSRHELNTEPEQTATAALPTETTSEVIPASDAEPTATLSSTNDM